MNKDKRNRAEQYVQMCDNLKNMKEDLEYHTKRQNFPIKVFKYHDSKMSSNTSVEKLEKDSQKELQEFYKDLVERDIQMKENAIDKFDI